MKKYHCYSAEFDSKTEELFKNATFLGQGNNGIVYSLPENKVIKLFVEEQVCIDEAATLHKANGSKYFPKMYKAGKLYIVREKVEGIQLDKYIKQNGINKKIVLNIYKLTKEFKKIGFTKIDTRCKDIMVDKDLSIMVIDPKKCFRRKINYPRHLLKGLKKLNVYEDFFWYLEDIDKKKAKEWKAKFQKYWAGECLKEKYFKHLKDEEF